jgi:hypothetical protein
MRVHVGEFERRLEILTGDEDRWLAEGREEVDEMVAEMAATGQEAATAEKGGRVAAVAGTPQDSP